MQSGLQEFPGNGEDGNDDDAENDDLHIFLNEREGSEEESCAEEEADPEDGTDDVVEEEFPIGHQRNARNKRSECADDGNEAGEDDGASAVFFIKRMSFHEVFPPEEPAGFVVKDFRAKPLADRVIYRIPKNRGDKQERGDDFPVEEVLGSDGSDGEEERIARQERGDDEARLAKDDEEEEGVDPNSVVLDEPNEVSFGVKEKIDEIVHGWRRGCGWQARRKSGTPAVCPSRR